MQLEEWDAFDVNRVAQLTQGRPLEAVTLEALHRFDLLEKLKLPREKLRFFLRVTCLPMSSLSPFCYTYRRPKSYLWSIHVTMHAAGFFLAESVHYTMDAPQIRFGVV